MVNVKAIMSFKAQSTEKIYDFEGVSVLVENMVKVYSKSYSDHNFSFRILLPRSKDSQMINNKSKKLGFQIQNDFLLGVKKLKLKPHIRDFRYIHDDDHFGWLLIDPSIYETLA